MLQRKEPLLENDDHDCGERRGGEWEERNEGAQLARGQGAAPPCLARLCHSEPYCAYCVVPPCLGSAIVCLLCHIRHNMAHYAQNGTEEVGLGNNIEQ